MGKAGETLGNANLMLLFQNYLNQGYAEFAPNEVVPSTPAPTGDEAAPDMGSWLVSDHADPNLGATALPARALPACFCLQSTESSSGQPSARWAAGGGNENIIILFKKSPAHFLGEILAMENIK